MVLVSARKGIQISDIKLLNPRARTSLGRSKFHIEIQCEDNRKAKTMKRYPDGDRVRWEESILLDVADITDKSMIAFTVMKSHLFITESIGSFKKNAVDLIRSGVCILEISKESQLKFSVEEMSEVLPAILNEASQLSAQITTEETSHTVEKREDDAWSLFLSRFKIFMDAIDAVSMLNPYVKLAWSILSLIPKTILLQKGQNKNIEKLCEKLKEIYDYIIGVERFEVIVRTQDKTFLSLVQQTIECAYFIREYGTRSIVGRAWRSGTVDDKIYSFNERLDHYLSVITGSITLETGILTLRVAGTTAESRDLILLNEMPYARGAGFISGKRCISGTRQRLIDQIVEWVNNNTSQRILFLSGQAGTGKSAIAHTIADIFRKQNRLGSIFCFNRSYKDRCNLLFSTISRGLADSDVLWRKRLVEVIQDTAIRTSMDPVTQFDELIDKPSKHVATVGPVVIVIDALDESGDREARATILELLFQRCSELPVNYRILITSRPEQDIEFLCDDPENIHCIRMDDIPIHETLYDIQSYVLNRLKPIAPILNMVERNWSLILANRAEGLFQWADTACRFIDPNVRYLAIVQERWLACISTSSSSLYKLYESVISSQDESKNSQFVIDFKTVVSAIIMAREPLTVGALQDILREVIPNVQDVLSPFGSLFHGVNNSFTPIQPLHTSLFDFFTDSSTKYYATGNSSVQGSFTLGCLQMMNRMLRFNICDLDTSHLANRHVSDFSERVATAVPSPLRYACYYWALHLSYLHSTDKVIVNNILTQLHTLMEENLLFWFEVLSLLNDVERGCSAMSLLRDWLQNAGGDQTTLAIQALDAYHFGLTCKQAMSGSTPHLYLSALPFAPRNSFIRKQYLPRYPHLISLDIDQSVNPAATDVGVTRRHPSSVPITCLTFSPNDRYIASGYDNGEICLLDYKTGEQVNQWKPLWNIESNGISDIVFSPDGRLVYICFRGVPRMLIWNIKTNGVKQECYDSVIGASCRSSIISSHGRYIAFGYSARVLLYDRTTSSIIGNFKCHHLKETRYQFSPSENLFAFVRGDETFWGTGVEVNLWTIRDQVVVESWSGCFSLALSDDYIAVLKLDGRMEVWDLTAMKMVHNLANRNHPRDPRFIDIQFSANNQHVFSSCGGTYHIWSLSTGELIYQSHTNGAISHLTLSPDLNYTAFADSDDPGMTYIRHWTPHVLPPPESSHELTNETSSVRNLWLHGPYLVLVLGHGLLQIRDITTISTVVLEVMIGRSAVLVFSMQDVVCVVYGVRIEERRSHNFTYRHELCLWVESEEQPTILDDSEGTVAALAFSPLNNYLIFGVNCTDITGRGTLKIWDIHERHFVVEPCSIEGAVKTLAFSSSGTSVFVAYIKDFYYAYFEIRGCRSGWPVLTGPFRCSVHSEFSVRDEIAFSVNKEYVIFASNRGVEIFDATTGKEVCWINYQQVPTSGRRLSPDGKYFAWVKEHELKVWDVDNNELLLEDRSGGNLSLLCFSNDSRQLVTIATSKDQESKDPGFDINVVSDGDSDNLRYRYYRITIRDIQTKSTVIKKVRYPEFEFDILALHDGHLVLGPSYSLCQVWSLHGLSAAATLYEQYIQTVFGAFPVVTPTIVRGDDDGSSDTSISITAGSLLVADDTNYKMLEYLQTAWNKAMFSNFTQVGRDGWVLGPHGELLFWVPKERRKGLWYPGMTHLTTKNVTKLNFDNFVHGSRWTKCREA